MSSCWQHAPSRGLSPWMAPGSCSASGSGEKVPPNPTARRLHSSAPSLTICRRAVATLGMQAAMQPFRDSAKPWPLYPNSGSQSSLMMYIPPPPARVPSCPSSLSMRWEEQSLSHPFSLSVAHVTARLCALFTSLTARRRWKLMLSCVGLHRQEDRAGSPKGAPSPVQPVSDLGQMTLCPTAP